MASMDSLGITAFDIGVFAVVGLSCVHAIGKGFTESVLSLLAWVGAVFATIYGLQFVRPWLQAQVEPAAFADAIAVVVLAIGSLILFKFLAGLIGRAIKGGPLGALDRALGALFGVLRGLFIVCVAFLVATWFIPRQNMPEWVKVARTRAIVEYGVSLLTNFTPAGLVEELDGVRKRGLDKNMMDAVKDRVPGSSFETGPKTGSKSDPGYRERDRDDLDSLIERNI